MTKPLPDWLPRAILSLARGYTANTFIADTQNALIGSAILAAGVPVFFGWRAWKSRR